MTPPYRHQQPVPRQPTDQDDLAARKTHLRTMAVAGALATVGAFAGLAASTDHTTAPTNPGGGVPPAGSGQQPAAPSSDGSSGGGDGSSAQQVPVDPNSQGTFDDDAGDDGFVTPTTPSTGQGGFSDPQGGFFGPGNGQSGVAPAQGSGGSGGPPSMSGSS